MVDPGLLTVALTTKLQSIAELVDLLGGDPYRIFPYRRRHPGQTNLQQAIYRMPIPSIMLVWEGTVPGRLGKNEVWKHKYALYLRAKEEVDSDASKGAYQLWQTMINGVPQGEGCDGLKMLYTTVHESCFALDTPAIIPMAGQTEDSKGIFEYFKVATALTEKGDY